MNLKPLAACLSLIVAALAIACGGDDNENTPQPTTAAGATQAPGASPTSPVSLTPPIGVTIAQPTAGASSGPPADACVLITREDAAAALGEAVGQAQLVALGSLPVAPGFVVTASSCSFDASAGTRTVTVTIWSPGTGTGAVTASQVRQIIESTVCTGKERVSGLGDLACWYDSTHLELQLVKGSVFADLEISQLSGPDRTQAIRALATKVAGRIR